MGIFIIAMTKIFYIVSASIACVILRHAFFAKRGNSFLRSNVESDGLESVTVPNVVNIPQNEVPKIEEVLRDTDMNGIYSDTAQTEGDASSSYTPEALADQVKDLPGLTFTPSFNHFSGYLQVSPTRHIHYWYIESMKDPSTDPVVFWTNGGPGCSGLLGLGTEMGPFVFEAGGKLSLNPFTWNNIANILYVEQPAGVGFSKFSDPDDANVGDERAAEDNYKLIKAFFERFPERKPNEFFIASESYGGHYMPSLAKTILSYNVDKSINFGGFMVGNPYVDPVSNDITMIQTYYMHGLIAKPFFELWEQNCVIKKNYDDSKCDGLMNLMMDNAGKLINPYAVDYPACTEPDNNDYPPQLDEEEIAWSSMENQILANGITSTNRRRMAATAQSARLLDSTSIRSPPFLPQADIYHPCAEAHLFAYLNRDDVKKALHVDIDRDWTMCTDDINYSEESRDTPQISLYEDLIAIGKQSGSNLKMMVFSGDDDSICSTASTQYWIWTIGADPVANMFWRPWKHENQTAGYITKFDLGENATSSFIFVTVHGAGHEVPAYRPSEALAMFTSYFTGQWELEDITF